MAARGKAWPNPYAKPGCQNKRRPHTPFHTHRHTNPSNGGAEYRNVPGGSCPLASRQATHTFSHPPFAYRPTCVKFRQSSLTFLHP